MSEYRREEIGVLDVSSVTSNIKGDANVLTTYLDTLTSTRTLEGHHCVGCIANQCSPTVVI